MHPITIVFLFALAALCVTGYQVNKTDGDRWKIAYAASLVVTLTILFVAFAIAWNHGG